MSKSLRVFIVVAVIVGLLSATGLAIPVGAEISPDTLTATLSPGESVSETKVVTIPDIPPRADVVFAFDLTGSMSGIISEAKSKAGDILSALDALSGVDIQYGVMSYMDYAGSYSSCGYSATYGEAASGDYPYQLDQAITSDNTAVTTAIGGLTLGYGGDGPQDYTRIFYESYADPNVSWRYGARRILVNFGDNVPHDCDLNEGVTSGTLSTGGDPGRDAIMGTGDDLDLQAVLADMATNGVILLECHTTTAYNTHWTYWTGLTGGDVYLTSSGTLVDDIVTAVNDALVDFVVYDLHLEASAGYESWLTYVDPSSYDELDPEDEVSFDITITVPPGTPPGVYSFTISALDEVGVSYGEQDVTIEVIPWPVPVDIKPTSCPNPLNVTAKGVLPVAILGTEDIDVSMIDPASVMLAGVAPLRWDWEDVAAPFDGWDEEKSDCWMDCTEDGPDGYMDLTLKFDTQEVIAALGEVNDGDCMVLTLTGNYFDGSAIEGDDVVVFLSKK